jgi:3-dehydroquinate dehydratase/shikimate dehydrogenase
MIVISTRLPLLPSLSLANADALDIWLEDLNETKIQELAEIKKKLPCALHLTWLDKGDSQKFAHYLQKLADIQPHYLALNYQIPKNALEMLKKNYPGIKLIGVYYNQQNTPINLTLVLHSMQEWEFDSYKMITTAHTTADALRMLQFMYEYQQQTEFPLTGLCHGVSGYVTQILSPIVKNHFHYLDADKSNELFTLYHFLRLNEHTKIYALLGDPVHLSVGHILHNRAIELLQENAVYVKLSVSKLRLAETEKLEIRLPFYGFSVTMPLKETIFSRAHYIDPFTRPIQAINTILIEDKKLFGFNTDGVGAIQALLERLSAKNLTGQIVAIMGCGGSARAIAYAARQYEAEVIIINRSYLKAEQLAQEIGAQAHALNNKLVLKNLNYTILINTLPEHVYSEEEVQQTINPNNLRADAVVMDIVYQPIETAFLKIARQANCICIPGYEMYIRQALLQIKHWFRADDEKLSAIKTMMQQFFNA